MNVLRSGGSTLRVGGCRLHALPHDHAGGPQELVSESGVASEQFSQSTPTKCPDDAGRDRIDLRYARHLSEKRGLSH
jgi:hypothetical protein